MLPADEVHAVRPGLCVWQRTQPSVKADCTSTAIRSDNGWTLIDPIPLTAQTLDSLTAEAPIAHIVLTSSNHGRAADWFRERFSVPVWAHLDALGGLDLAVDRTFREGDRIGSLEVISLPGGAMGESAFYDERGFMTVGDALIHLPGHGFDLLPDRYCQDRERLRAELQKLLRFPFDVLTFAHGLPLVTRARLRVAALLE